MTRTPQPFGPLDPTPSRITVIKCRCIGCGHIRQITQGTIPAGEHPMCDQCLMPMVPVSARVTA